MRRRIVGFRAERLKPNPDAGRRVKRDIKPAFEASRRNRPAPQFAAHTAANRDQ